MKIFANIKGDIAGAVSATIMQLPSAITFGIVAFSPLGSEFASQGVLLSLYGTVFCGFFAALFGGSRYVISGPSGSLSLITASFIVSVTASSVLQPGVDQRSVVLVGLAAACVFMGGAFQALFGALRLGSIIKYIPYPVVSGFSNGIAVLLIYNQLKPLLGIESKKAFLDILANPAMSIKPLTFIEGVFTILVLFFSNRLTKRIPATLVGLIFGSAFHYALAAVADPSSVSALIGRIEGGFPRPDIFLRLFDFIEAPTFWTLFPHILATGFALALFGSMLSLLTSITLDNSFGTRHNSNRELLGQGIGNMISSIFGGVAGASAIPRSVANYQSGGRTPLSGMFCSFLNLLIALSLGGLVGKLPLVIFASIAFMAGIHIMDKWTISIFKMLAHSYRSRALPQVFQEREVLVDFAVSIVVSGAIIFGNLVFGIGLGIVLASALFIMKMAKSTIRRKYYGDKVRSRVMRPLKDLEVLERLRGQIVVFELQGALFFGSAEKLAKEIEITLADLSYCILDMKRVSSIDSTGANIILQVCRALTRSGKRILICHMGESLPLKNFLSTMDAAEVIGERHFFQDTDAALEWAEEDLLAKSSPFSADCREVELNQLEILEGFTPGELDSLKTRLLVKTYGKGELIITEGDENRDLFMLMKGSVSVRIPHADSNHQLRVAAYYPGISFGEMGLLDGRSRSADVFCENDSTLYILPYGRFLCLQKEAPELAIKLLVNIGKGLSRNLRLSNEERIFIEAS
jgi:anti-anti-sigma factor